MSPMSQGLFMLLLLVILALIICLYIIMEWFDDRWML